MTGGPASESKEIEVERDLLRQHLVPVNDAAAERPRRGDSGVISRFMTISATVIAGGSWLASTAAAGCAAGRAAIARLPVAPTPGGMERFLAPRRDAASSMLRRQGAVGNPGSGLADLAESPMSGSGRSCLPDPRLGLERRNSPPPCRQLCSRPLSRPARSLCCNDRSRREVGSRAYSDYVCAIRPQYPNGAATDSIPGSYCAKNRLRPFGCEQPRDHRRIGAMTIPNRT